MKNNILLGGIAIILLAVGAGAGYYYRTTVETGAAVKLQKVYEMLNEPSYMNGGNIAAINGNIIVTEKTDNLSGKVTRIEVVVGEGTVLEKMTVKTDEEKAADLVAYRAALEEATSAVSVPVPSVIKRTTISLADLKVGDFIQYGSAKKIGNETRIDAVTILVELPR